MKKLLFFLAVVLVISFFFTGKIAAQDSQGKIINMHGKVHHYPSKQEIWNLARILQKLFIQDKVRTFLGSRAAILFIDETQVRLNGDAELTVRSVMEKGEKSSIFELIKGEGWFRTKNPSSKLSVTTAAVTAAIRGSEINIRVNESGETILTVLEGTIKFFNDAGSILVNTGEEAIARPGEVPTKRAVLNPEDAVQWVLYYPTSISWYDLLQENLSNPIRSGFKRLQAGDVQAGLVELSPYLNSHGWARIGSALAYMELGEMGKANQVLELGVPSELETERLAVLAAIAVSAGDVEAARELIDKALKIDPKALRVLTLLSTIELIQNKKDKARGIANRALSAHPYSVSAFIKAGEAAQAFFNLDEAAKLYSRALILDENDIRARVNRARIRFGSGDTKGAQEDAEYASRISPDDAQVQSLLGFIKLSRGEKKEARIDFEKAIENNPDLGEPHLGLGLINFQQGKEDDGLWEMLIATLLEPKVSLFQSYLGKAYHHLKRNKEGLSALETAARLDLRDPTPRLYRSLFLRDMNRYVDALDELNKSIELNDNRAVYRSRLLLDQDRATKNVNLAQVYWQLGFAPWGVYEALNSLNADITNPSAHLFLAGLYGNIPDRLQAQGSELLQYMLLAPVNRSLFSSFNEYTVLFDEPYFSYSLYGEGAYPLFGLGEIGTRSGNDHFAHLVFFNYKLFEGARPDELDQRYYGYGQAKVALGKKTDLLVDFYYTHTDYGNDETEVITVGKDTAYPMNIQIVAEEPDKNWASLTSYLGSTLGFKHIIGTSSPFIACVQYENIRDFTTDPDTLSTIPDLFLYQEIESDWDMYDAQAQQIFRIGRKNQLITGIETYSTSLARHDYIDPYGDFYGTPVNRGDMDWDDYFSSDNWGFAFWLWDKFQILNCLHSTVGVRFQKDVGESLLYDQNYNYTGFYPLIGLSWNISNNAVLRAAAFQRLNTRLFGSKISPTTVEGFLLERNETEYTKRSEIDLAFETSGSRLFQMTHLFYRNNVYPPKGLITYEESEHMGLNNYLNLIVTRFLCLFVENQFLFISTIPFTEISDQFKTGITYTTPFGLMLRITDSVIMQTYQQSIISELTDSFFNLLDLEVKFDFPGKKGGVDLLITNLLDQKFSTFIEGLSLNPILPYRRIFLTFSLRI
jgi:tetratricopeptide (TPR) repeat protein